MGTTLSIETSNESTNSSESNGATSSSTESDGRDKIAVVFGTSTSRMQGSEDTTDDSSHNTTTHFAFPGTKEECNGTTIGKILNPYTLHYPSFHMNVPINSLEEVMKTAVQR